MRKGFHRLFIYLIVIMAGVINIYSLFSQSIRIDESQVIWTASKSLPAIIDISFRNFEAPLYPLILHFWMLIFGTSVYLVRLMSFLFLLATLPFLYRLARRTGNEEIGILAVVLFSISPFIVWYSSEAWMFTLFTLFVTVNHLYFLELYHSGAKEGKFDFFLSGVMGLFTSYSFVFILVSQLIFTAGLLFARKIRPLTFLLIFWLFVLTALPFFLWIRADIMGGYLASLSLSSLSYPTNYGLLQIFVNFLFGFPSVSVQTFLVSLWPLITMVILFVFTRGRKVGLEDSRYLLVITFLPILLVYGFSFFQPIFLSRNLIFATPTLFLLIAWLMYSYTKRLYAPLNLIVFLAMFMLAVFQISSPSVTVREDYAGVTNFIQATATPHDIILVTPPFSVFPIEYYYRNLVKIDTIPAWDSNSGASVPPKFSMEAFRAQIAGYERTYSRMIVIYSGGGNTARVKQYLDTHFARINEVNYPSSIQVAIYRLRYDTQIQ